MPHSPSPEARKRKRTSLACDNCRQRKVRCDGRNPCQSCVSASEDCAYGTDTLPKSKSDMILDVAIRSETLLREISSRLSFVNGVVATSQQSVDMASSPLAIISPTTTDSAHRHADLAHTITNAILSPFHASTMETILAWPHFDAFPKLRMERTFSVFHLEHARPSLPQRPSAMLPYASRSDMKYIIQCFSDNVNYWYPTMAQTKIRELEQRILSGCLDDSVSSCLALLLMALGSASGLVSSIVEYEKPGRDENERRNQQKLLSELYFDSALKKIHMAQMECTIDAVQCLFFAGLYFAFQQRPLQAWSFISATATKCRLLSFFQKPDSLPEESECLRRIFWSCYILESDYLAELSALPQSGIADIESSVSLPSDYHTHESQIKEEQSSIYFLACISIRRLLNRVHNLLYAKDTGAGFDEAQFPSAVSELNHQLEQWRELLPPDFQFSVDSEPAKTTQGAFLRQRYLTCKSVIYRPYLTWALSNSARIESLPNDMIGGVKCCLDACWMHAFNLQNFAHTIMVDTWICSLSMASAMLIILAASQTRALRECISSKTVLLGPHLESLLRCWMRIPGQGPPSPSVERSVELIGEVSILLDRVLGKDGGLE